METLYRNSDFTDYTLALNSYLSINTLNVNELNMPIKRHMVTKWIKIIRPMDMLLTSDSF